MLRVVHYRLSWSQSAFLWSVVSTISRFRARRIIVAQSLRDKRKTLEVIVFVESLLVFEPIGI